MPINYNNEDLVDHDGIAAVIKNKAGEIIIQEHVKYGFWTIPVGKVMPEQDVLEGLRQEISEECNIDIQECKELCVKDYFYERNGRNVIVTSHMYEITKYSGVVRNNEPDKHRQQIFMPIEKIMELPYISDLTVAYLKMVGFKRGNRINHDLWRRT